MTGYREAGSGYDPNAYEALGRPLRPYNWVQWTGVAIGGLGVLLATLDLLGEIGWIRVGDSLPAAPLLLFGFLLVNSRREASTLITPEQQARNKRMLYITLAVCAVMLGIAAFIEFGPVT